MPSPCTMLNTPAGKPASCIISAKSAEESGATSDGLSTIVQPAPTAGPTFRVTWFIGQFHGVIMATTPTGSLRIQSPGAWSPRGSSKAKFLSVSIVFRRCHEPAPTCAVMAMSMGAPISSEMASPISALRAS